MTTLAAPTISSATAGAGAVSLSWSAVSGPGSGTATYYVTRDGGAPAGDCPTSTSPSSQTSCTDSGVSVATHQYTVTATWRTWTATSQTATVQVTFGPATHFLLGAATTTPAAGAADNLTITALDASNRTVSNYTGSHSLTFAGASTIGAFTPTVKSSSGAAVGFGSGTAISFTSGAASVSGTSNGVMTLYKAETASITVSDGTISNGAGLSVTVGPGTAASLSLTATTATPSAGAADNLTITALDAYGNTATGYTGSHGLSFGGASTIGTNHPTVANSSGTATNFATATSINFANGVATVSGSANGVMTLYKAETASITVSDGAITNGAGLSVTVGPGTAASLSLTAATTTPGAGAADNLTITALDAYGNTAISYSGAKNLTFGGASTIGTHTPTVTNSLGVAINFGVATTTTFSSGVATVSGSSNGVMTLYKAQTASITVTDGTITNGTGQSVTVSPAAAASISLAAATTTPTSGAADNLTITASDTYGNGLTGAQSLTFGGAHTIGSFSPTVANSSGTAVAFGTPTSINFTNGTASVSGSSNGVMKLYKAETALITVSDGAANNGTGLLVTVGAAAATPSGLAYVDNNTTTADQVTGTTTANVTVTATQTVGDHVGNTYTATATATGSFTINVEAWNGSGGVANHKTFTYSVTATDLYGNPTAAATVTATDAK